MSTYVLLTPLMLLLFSCSGEGSVLFTDPLYYELISDESSVEKITVDEKAFLEELRFPEKKISRALSRSSVIMLSPALSYSLVTGTTSRLNTLLENRSEEDAAVAVLIGDRNLIDPDSSIDIYVLLPTESVWRTFGREASSGYDSIGIVIHHDVTEEPENLPSAAAAFIEAVESGGKQVVSRYYAANEGAVFRVAENIINDGIEFLGVYAGSLSPDILRAVDASELVTSSVRLSQEEAKSGRWVYYEDLDALSSTLVSLLEESVISRPVITDMVWKTAIQ